MNSRVRACWKIASTFQVDEALQYIREMISSRKITRFEASEIISRISVSDELASEALEVALTDLPYTHPRSYNLMINRFRDNVLRIFLEEKISQYDREYEDMIRYNVMVLASNMHSGGIPTQRAERWRRWSGARIVSDV